MFNIGILLGTVRQRIKETIKTDEDNNYGDDAFILLYLGLFTCYCGKTLVILSHSKGMHDEIIEVINTLGPFDIYISEFMVHLQ